MFCSEEMLMLYCQKMLKKLLFYCVWLIFFMFIAVYDGLSEENVKATVHGKVEVVRKLDS